MSNYETMKIYEPDDQERTFNEKIKESLERPTKTADHVG
jgi:hypothetical protein